MQKHPLTPCLRMMGCALLAPTLRTDLAAALERSNVVWDSPSANSLGSMPLGNGDIGANVWVEPSGDLVLLLSKTDAYDDFARLLKVGRVRIKIAPALVRRGVPFRQTLNLREGCIDIQAGDTTVRVWIDANHPVVQVDYQGGAPLAVEAAVEIWRTRTRPLDRTHGRESELHGAYGNFPETCKVHPDTVLPRDAAGVAWCHHNIESIWKRNLEHTGLAAEIPNHTDPLLGRTFGAVLRGAGMKPVTDLVLKSVEPARSGNIRITVLTRFAESPADWHKAANALAAKSAAGIPARLEAHRAWWRAFWNRSWIVAGGNTAPASLFPNLANKHPWRVGIDSAGGSRFLGEIAEATVVRGVRTSFPEAAAVGNPSGGAAHALPGADTVFEDGVTVSAWIKPAGGETGRILDKAEAGRPGGYTFDTFPGLSLRWIVDRHTMIAHRCLTPGRWSHVAATVAPASGAMRIYLDGKLLKEEVAAPAGADDARLVTQSHALQRFINACAGRGRLPIKFNGSLFTVDEFFDPDYRRWGGPYWLQNTRLPYWSMLGAGDYDLMQPLFRMYAEMLPLRKAATRTYFGHDGAYYPETAHFWGNYADLNYGLNRGNLPAGLTENRFIRRHWVGILEIVGMMLDYYEATQDAAFRDETLLPMAVETFRFYDQHWKRGADGKIRYEPSQSLETYFDTVNPTPDIAAIRYLMPRLLTLPVPEAIRAEWQRQLADQPEIPLRTVDGKPRILAAQKHGNAHNVENPELYAVFPFRLYTLANASEQDAQIGIATFHARLHKANIGWQQGPIWAAMLGLTQEARSQVVQRARDKAKGYRFPGFYGPNYDWTPDQDQIGVFQLALQYMLMQCEGDKILILPAWPKELDVSFKLHAPKNTTVECEVRGGKVVKLDVVPEFRRNDIVIHPPFR